MIEYSKINCGSQPAQNNQTMSDREPTRWQHDRIYPHPINPCEYTYDSIGHLQISI